MKAKQMTSGKLAVIGVVCFIGNGILQTNGITWAGWLFGLTGVGFWVAALVRYFTKERKR